MAVTSWKAPGRSASLCSVLDRKCRRALGRAPVQGGSGAGLGRQRSWESVETYERERDAGRLLELEDMLGAIDRALRRLEEGTYGVSVVSGRPIPDDRLEALPWAARTA